MMYRIVKQAISKELSEFVYSYFLMKRNVARKFYNERYISPYNFDWGVVCAGKLTGKISIKS